MRQVSSPFGIRYGCYTQANFSSLTGKALSPRLRLGDATKPGVAPLNPFLMFEKKVPIPSFHTQSQKGFDHARQRVTPAK